MRRDPSAMSMYSVFCETLSSMRKNSENNKNNRVSEACSSVGVSDGEGRFSYPVRRETGIGRVARSDTPAIKSHRKSDNRDFLGELKQFTRDN
jgi:hypothetical protein